MSRADGKTSEAVASFIYEETLSPSEKNSLSGTLGVQLNEVDLIIIFGQSNSYGAGGNASLAPVISPNVLQWTTGGGVAALALTNGTSGGETLGSGIAPQFANTYNAATGRRVCFVLAAGVDGASMTAAGEQTGGTFDATGTTLLRGQVVSRTASAKTALEALGYKVNLIGGILLQGEQDAVMGIAGSVYLTAISGLTTYLRANIAAEWPIYLIRTGTRTGTADTNPQIIRDAQNAFIATTKNTAYLYKSTEKFPFMSFLADTVHYNQAGMNWIGWRAALAMLGISTPADDVVTTGVMTDQKPGWSFRGTMPTTITAANNAIDIAVTGAGSSAFISRAVNANLAAGYTGSASTFCGYFTNFSAGTGSTLINFAGFNSPTGNIGLGGVSAATTTGANLGVIGLAQGGGINVGVFGSAQVAKNSAVNIGGLFTAINTGTSPTQIGVHATLNGSNPTVSAAMSASNGTTTSPILILQDNTSTVLTVSDGGGVTATGFIQTNSIMKPGTYTVATLPSASGSPNARAGVSDALTPLATGVGATVVGGGANFTPVYSDGTNWKQG